MPFNVRQSYRIIEDMDGVVFLQQNGLWYDRNGHVFASIPPSQYGYFPPYDTFAFDGSGNIIGFYKSDGTITPLITSGTVPTFAQLAAPGGAALIGNTPAGGIAASTVQAAVNELDTEKASLTTLSGAGGAALVGNNPAGTISSVTVQGAINEIVSDLAAAGGAATVGNTPAGSIAAVTVQGAINELDTEKTSVALLAAGGGAALVGNTPAGNIAAITVQTAINELDTEKVPLAFKDATGGYAGLTLFDIDFKNSANTFTSFLRNTNTASRVYSYQDRDGTIADLASFASPPALGNTTPAAVNATTITATSTITPAQLAGIVGTTTNNSANTGSVGEFVTATASGISLSSGVSVTTTSVSLTAGDWDVSGTTAYSPAGTTPIIVWYSGTSLVNNTLGALGTTQQIALPSASAGSGQILEAPVMRYSLSATTTVYLIATANFTVSTCTASGVIRARRVR